MRKLSLKLGAVVLTAFAAGSVLGPVSSGVAESGSSDTFKQLKLFGDVFERVRSEYVEEVSDQKLIESAINGMLSSLDPHSGYLDTEHYRDMQVQTRGEFGGLGIEVTMENGLVKVVSPIDDTPAYKAGIKSGDLITHIDGEPVMGLSLSEAVEKMRGPVDSESSSASSARARTSRSTSASPGRSSGSRPCGPARRATSPTSGSPPSTSRPAPRCATSSRS